MIIQCEMLCKWNKSDGWLPVNIEFILIQLELNSYLSDHSSALPAHYMGLLPKLSFCEVVFLSSCHYLRLSSNEIVFLFRSASCEFILLWGRLPVSLSFWEVVFLWALLPLKLYFSEVVFLWDCLPLMLSSCEVVCCEVVFLWSCLPVRSSYCEDVFLWGNLPVRSSSMPEPIY